MSSLNTVDSRLNQMLCVANRIKPQIILKEKQSSENTELVCKCVCVCLQPGLRNILINFVWDPIKISKTDVLVV